MASRPSRGVKRKQQRGGGGGSAPSPSTKKPSTRIDFGYDDASDASSGHGGDHIESDDEEEHYQRRGRAGEESSEDESDKETADEKRVRLAREYLKKVEQDAGSSSSSGSEDDSEDDDDDGSGGDETPESDAEGAAAASHDKLSRKLAKQRLSRTGGLSIKIAAKVSTAVDKVWKSLTVDFPDPEAQAKAFVASGAVSLRRGHDLTPTAVALHDASSADGKSEEKEGQGAVPLAVAYSAGKDGTILMWDVQQGKKLHTLASRFQTPAHTEGDKHTDANDAHGGGRTGGGVSDRRGSEVLALAASDDGKYLAVGSRDATVRVYDVRQRRPAKAKAAAEQPQQPQPTQFRPPKLLDTFTGHKSSINALSFRPRSLDMYSGSDDRTVRRWTLEGGTLTHVETLYGHQGPVSAVACPPKRERPISTGRDRTVRAWKLAEETHLIFRPGGSATSADCVSCADDVWFVSGHDDGALRLWMGEKKKPVATVKEAHGRTVGGGLPNGVHCLDVLANSDLAVTGSNDGYLRLWRIVTDDHEEGEVRGVEAVGKVPVWGCVNAVKLGPGGRYAVCAVGQEPRLGRWDRVQRARNRFVVVTLRADVEEEKDEKQAEEQEEDKDGDNDDDDDEASSEEEEGSSESESGSDDDSSGKEEEDQGGSGADRKGSSDDDDGSDGSSEEEEDDD